MALQHKQLARTPGLGSMRSMRARQVGVASVGASGVADKVNSLLKENFPDAKDMDVKFYGGACDRAHLSVDFQFELGEEAALEPALAASLAKAADESRGLAMDGVAKANSGHLGLPLGAAEVGAVLFGSKMMYNPEDPTWINRDRFILSAGHGSMFLYSWLHMAGYALPKEELAKFRQLDSMTPGHPNFRRASTTRLALKAPLVRLARAWPTPWEWQWQRRWQVPASIRPSIRFSTTQSLLSVAMGAFKRVSPLKLRPLQRTTGWTTSSICLTLTT